MKTLKCRCWMRLCNLLQDNIEPSVWAMTATGTADGPDAAEGPFIKDDVDDNN